MAGMIGGSVMKKSRKSKIESREEAPRRPSGKLHSPSTRWFRRTELLSPDYLILLSCALLYQLCPTYRMHREDIPLIVV
jgi:hypothetical protein